MTDAEKIERGEHALRLLTDRLLSEVIAQTEADSVEALLTCDVEKRIDHIAAIRAIRELRNNLQSIVTTGKNAASKGS